MTVRRTAWPAGVPCWADLSVPDVARARAFYTAVLGWSFEDTGDEYGGYVIGQVEGSATAGIGPFMAEGQSSAWTLYLASDDVDATADAIRDAGGVLLVQPGDVGPAGRMCVAADPSGAVFGVWQAGEMFGSAWVNAPGGLAWEDLRSTDPDAAIAFYGSVFGYETQELEMAGPDYRMFALPGAGEQGPLGGMGGMMGAPEGTPSHWLVYFGVADTDVAVAAALEHGGSQLGPAFDSPFGRMAPLTDPFGAVLWLVQVAPDQRGSGAPERE